MRISKLKQFLVVFASFLVLGIAFKVMVLIEGLTEVRPVNAIPPVAGLLFGPIGALACGAANVVCDLFGTFSIISVFGFFSNAVPCCLTYRLWHLFSEEQPNMRSWKNIFLYVGISFVTAATAGWILSFFLHMAIGQWVELLFDYVFLNNLGFSVALGLPLIIFFTAQDSPIRCAPRPKRSLLAKHKKLKYIVCLTYLGLMILYTVWVLGLGINPTNTPWTAYATIPTLILLLLQLI